MRPSVFALLPLFLLSTQNVLAEPGAAPTYTTQDYARKFATGLKRTKESAATLASMPRTSFRTNFTPIPGKTNLRSKTSKVEDQGFCGSCWDFSLTSALRGTWMLAGKDPGRLSFNYLLNCATNMDGCEGGDFPAADLLIDPKGAPAYGSDGPYTGAQGQCQPEKEVASAIRYHLLGSARGANPDGVSPSFKDIAYVVGVLGRPVSIDLNATDKFEKYKNGIFNACDDADPNNINHMVVIEGYDCQTAVDSQGNCKFDENGNLPGGVGVWIVRNSWGVTWGEKGYFTIKATDSKGQRCNAVATNALYFDLTDFD